MSAPPPSGGATTAASAAGGATTASEAERWVGEFAEGWRRPAGAESFADHFERVCDPEVRLIQPGMPTIVGTRAFRERFARPLFEAIPDLHATVHHWAARGDVVYIEFTLAGTLGGRPLSWECVDRVTLRDGLAVERRAYFDPRPLLGAIATRPRSWPAFARLAARRLFRSRKEGNR